MESVTAAIESAVGLEESFHWLFLRMDVDISRLLARALAEQLPLLPSISFPCFVCHSIWLSRYESSDLVPLNSITSLLPILLYLIFLLVQASLFNEFLLISFTTFKGSGWASYVIGIEIYMDILGSLSILSGRATKFQGEDPV